MKLNVLERIITLQILPAEGDFTTLRIVREMKSKLSFSESELKDFQIKQDNNQVTWNAKAEEETEIELGDKATEIIKEALTRLDREKKLTPQHFTLYEKFVQDK